jgi:citrate lyase subunit beta / citryl-CoA lyase
MRSLLFVPGDRPDRFAKAISSGADALILDLEDSVAPERKREARAAVGEFLSHRHPLPILVRVNLGLPDEDLKVVLRHRPHAIVLPKAEGASSIAALVPRLEGVKLLPIATETPRAIFTLGSYGEVAEHLIGLTWGAEDLPAAIGATVAREPDGRFTPPYEMVRALTLFGAHAAKIDAIETVYPDITDTAGLSAYALRGRRDGFAGMLAIHPAQVSVINQAFSATETETAWARRVIDGFCAHPGAGAIQLDGKMLDRPHLLQAEAILARTGKNGRESS